jgi:hypothetical protein
MNPSKEEVAQRLAEAHYDLEPGMEFIIQLVASPEREMDPAEPVKLLEVNRDTVAWGIHPLFFGAHPDSGIIYPSIIIQVTPEEYEGIQREPASLPNGWRLGREFTKAEPVGRQ